MCYSVAPRIFVREHRQAPFGGREVFMRLVLVVMGVLTVVVPALRPWLHPGARRQAPGARAVFFESALLPLLGTKPTWNQAECCDRATLLGEQRGLPGESEGLTATEAPEKGLAALGLPGAGAARGDAECAQFFARRKSRGAVSPHVSSPRTFSTCNVIVNG